MNLEVLMVTGEMLLGTNRTLEALQPVLSESVLSEAWLCTGEHMHHHTQTTHLCP